MTQAFYRFLSSVRRGAAAFIAPDEDGVRASMRATLTFEGDPSLQASVPFTLSGPGDVTGFDERAVVRVWPPRETRDAEPNLFPLVEFDQVDLPWRYTPRKANDQGRLQPWLCLLAVEESNCSFRPASGTQTLASVTLSEGTPLPPPDQLWAWAHVQLAGDDSDEAVGDVISLHPERAVARLLCPLRLKARTTYWGLLVPTFAPGSPLAPAWTGTAVPAGGLTLPVYYRWRFGTGSDGDFESLVRLVQPKPIPAAAGTRPIDLSRPGGGLPAAAEAPLSIGGALQAPDALPWEWPADNGARADFVAGLADVLNAPAEALEDGADPVVAPPLYGQWYAERSRLVASLDPPEPLDNPPWFQGLNADPRSRIAAALGTEVVQDLQNALMESAWTQLAGIRETNDQLRKAQLARAVGQRLHLRFVQPASADALLQLSGNALRHVLHEGKTTHAYVRDSPARLALVSGALRRLFRPRGPIGWRQGRSEAEASQLLTNVNANAGDSETPAGPHPVTQSDYRTFESVAGFLQIPFPPSAENVASQPARLGLVVWDPMYDGTPPLDEDPPGSTETESMMAFREALTDFADRNVTPGSGGTLRRLDLAVLKATVAAALDPSTTIAAAFGARLAKRTGFTWNPPDPLEPVLAHPEFAQPMYLPLSEISQEWILPGLSAMNANTAGLAITNPAFIEAYLVGLNHEFARELLWNEYPTDQRGTFFRQFWSVTGLATTPVPEAFKDIDPIAGWPDDSELGTHSPRTVPPDLVLVVRAEALRRYPGTLVYAQRASGVADAWTLADPAEIRRPVFAGRLRPDVAFFGFDLTEADVRGGPSDPGWFFVFEEQPGEPKFGLDATSTTSPASWDDLGWPDLETAAGEYVDLTAAVPAVETIRAALTAVDDPEADAGWQVSPGSGMPFARGADHAVITLQRPVRVAIHATKLLPPP